MKIEIDVPDGVSGDWRVETFEISETLAKFSQLRSIINCDNRSAIPGIYKKLMHKNTIVMSNTPAEIRDHICFIHKAKKSESVLINGLGLGVALTEILKDNTITKRIDIVEINQDVINLVAPTYLKDPRVNIIHQDALTYKAPRNVKYNAVWHDIWNFICSDNLEQMKTLHRKYGKKSDWQGSWCRELCER